jgi:hypothetical protein
MLVTKKQSAYPTVDGKLESSPGTILQSLVAF